MVGKKNPRTQDLKKNSWIIGIVLLMRFLSLENIISRFDSIIRRVINIRKSDEPKIVFTYIEEDSVNRI